MFNVVHFKPDGYLPTTENWIYSQISHLVKYDPIVYTEKTENTNHFPVRNLRLVNYHTNNNLLIKIQRKLTTPKVYKEWLTLDNPAVIHAHFGPAGYQILPIAMASNTPLITTFYGHDLSSLPRTDPKWATRYLKLFRDGRRFLVEGSFMKKGLAQLGCPLDKITVFHLGIDVEKISFTPRRLEEGGSIKFLVAGRFVEKKGIPFAIKAFAKVMQSHPHLRMEMSIIGDSSVKPGDDEEKKNILTMVKNYSLGPSVKFLGNVTYAEFAEQAKQHHIFVSPSVTAQNGDSEGGAPVSIIEMEASGMPVLSTLHCDIPEVVRNGISGFLVPERDVDALAQKMELMINYPDAWVRMGELGRKHVEEHYNATVQGRLLESIYDEVAKAHVES